MYQGRFKRMGYKGIAKPYNDFKLKITRVIIGDKCRIDHVSKLQKYLESNNINYVIREKDGYNTGFEQI